MAFTVTPSNGIPAKCIGLEAWMERALEKMDRVHRDWDAGEVHDLRVALRRCRTMADALKEVNPDPGWRKLKKSSRDLFHALGELRNTQVGREWVKKLGPAGDPVRKHMLRVFSTQEKAHRKAAEEALDAFEGKNWRKWSKKLEAKSQFFPLESVVFQRLALERLNEAVNLHQRARKRSSAAAWHRLRIGIKSFRYVVENFLPRRYEVWADDMKKLQDLLGELHDLDVLRSDVQKQASKIDPTLISNWMSRIEAARKERLDAFRAITASRESPWIVWRAGFNWGHELKNAGSQEPHTISYAS
jgi:CHAD domain-containing protein